MADEDNPTPDAPLEDAKTTRRQGIWNSLRKSVSKAGDITGEAARKGAQIGGHLAEGAAQAAQATVSRVQRKLGEDYYAILAENPLLSDTLSRSSLLIENRELLSTAFNIPWATTLLWSATAGSALALQRPVAVVLGDLLHYAPGHIKHWDEINRFMDSAVGVGHRLKFGHSIEYLPQIVEKFGVDGVPAYFMHLLQDLTTVDGIPIVPNAWNIKESLQVAGMPRKIATGLVSISFSSVLGALAVITLVTELWKFGQALTKKLKVQNYLKTATAAVQSRDYNGAVANYQRALEIERSPHVLMALGQVYMQRAASRLRAHQAFIDAVTLLADNPASTIPYGQAKLCIRGLAGVQALATADVVADMHPEHWNDHIQDLVNASVHSFASAASHLAKESEDLVPDSMVTPSQFSAAINYYLAAKSACYYPFAEERQETVTRNIQHAIRSLGLMAQYDEERLRKPASMIRQLWATEVLPPDEIEVALASY